MKFIYSKIFKITKILHCLLITHWLMGKLLRKTSLSGQYWLPHNNVGIGTRPLKLRETCGDCPVWVIVDYWYWPLNFWARFCIVECGAAMFVQRGAIGLPQHGQVFIGRKNMNG